MYTPANGGVLRRQAEGIEPDWVEHYVSLHPPESGETFPAAEARRIAKRLEFHHTPKHGSWLNMAEIEFSVVARACLKRRNPDEDVAIGWGQGVPMADVEVP